MDVKFKMGEGQPSNYEKGSLIIDKVGKKIYIDTTDSSEGRIQIGGGITDSEGQYIEEVKLIPINVEIDDSGTTQEYYLLAIPKETNN